MAYALQGALGDSLAHAALHHRIVDPRADHLNLLGSRRRSGLGGGFELEYRDPVGDLLAFLDGRWAAAGAEAKCKQKEQTAVHGSPEHVSIRPRSKARSKLVQNCQNLDVRLGPGSMQPMPRTREVAPAASAPESLLRQATLARTSDLRAKYARQGLERGRRLDSTTRSMLLRQLYLSLLEQKDFAEALQVAEQNLKTGVLKDVVCQDAARACIGLGEIERAASYLRLASRIGPASRRSFHNWTLGSVLYLAQEFDQAILAFSRAVRWGTTDRPLYRAQLALARRGAGQKDDNLAALYDQLAEVPCGSGYGQFVLGELAYHCGDWSRAREHLLAFVKRTQRGRPALAVALRAEMTQARRLLASLRRRLRGK